MMAVHTHTHKYIHTYRHSQALDNALKLYSLAPESMVSTVASSRFHHLGPLVPHYCIGWRERKRE